MGTETIATLVIVGVIVAVLALHVFLIGLGLKRLSFTLGTIVLGLRAIRDRTMPVGSVLGGIVGDVTGIESDLKGVLGAVGEALGAPGPAERTSMTEAVARARGDAAPPPPAPAPAASSRPAPAAARSENSAMRQAVAKARDRVGAR